MLTFTFPFPFSIGKWTILGGEVIPVGIESEEANLIRIKLCS